MIEDLTSRGNTTFNLFLPFQRGGLGFECPSKGLVKITSFQRRFASYLENYFLHQLEEHKDPGSGPLGLIQIRSDKSGLSLHHVPSLQLDSVVGPLQKDVVVYLPRTYLPPALSQPVDPERPEMKVRFPKKKIFTEFRSRSWNRMSTKEIMSWPFRLVERIEDFSTPDEIQYALGFEFIPEEYILDLWN
jgi:hypothetical protein